MTVRAPATDDELCEKCGAANHGTAISVWRVADERGLHWECDQCAHHWVVPRPPVVSTLR
jgi:DNA-directed RNA polymerase subunit M/transcription elongation factor TFIIS